MVVGLGNPGAEYAGSRHNVGFLVVEELADRVGAAMTRRRHRSLFARGIMHGEEIVLVKPLTFMNESGRAVSGWQQALGLEPSRIIVIHDDLDLPTSGLRIKAGGGHGGHKGVRSIAEALGSADFLRVKVGIGRPHPGHDPVAHVLGSFEDVEREAVEAGAQQAADAVETLVRDGLRAAMNRYNVRAARRPVRQAGTEGEREGRELV
jgi:PTH1 family peptidyl-tRNA hydrolase